MAKVKSLVNLVLMSIVTAVRFTMKELEPFNRVYFEGFSYLCRLYGRYKRKVQAIQGVGATAARGCPTL